MQEARVPAAPPDRRLNNFILDVVMVREATRVDPPRQVDFPPRRMLVALLAPPSGMVSGVGDDVALLLIPLLHLLD